MQVLFIMLTIYHHEHRNFRSQKVSKCTLAVYNKQYESLLSCKCKGLLLNRMFDIRYIYFHKCMQYRSYLFLTIAIFSSLLLYISLNLVLSMQSKSYNIFFKRTCHFFSKHLKVIELVELFVFTTFLIVTDINVLQLMTGRLTKCLLSRSNSLRCK